MSIILIIIVEIIMIRCLLQNDTFSCGEICWLAVLLLLGILTFTATPVLLITGGRDHITSEYKPTVIVVTTITVALPAALVPVLLVYVQHHN